MSKMYYESVGLKLVTPCPYGFSSKVGSVECRNCYYCRGFDVDPAKGYIKCVRGDR